MYNNNIGIFFIFITIFLISFSYIYYTPFYLRQHDLRNFEVGPNGGHLGYIAEIFYTNKLPEGKFNKTEIVVDNLDKIEEPKEQWVYYLEPSNIPNPIIAKAVDSAIAPELASLITAKGLPIYFIKKDGDGKQNIAIIEERDLEELQVYLENLNYKIYLTDTISFTNEQQIKIATNLDNTEAFEFVLSNEDNKLKLAAYTVILNQYGDKQVTVALKRQIWKDVFYNASDYYIYLK